MTDRTKRSLICDHCGEELIVDSSYPAKYSLQLRAVDTGINTSGSVYAVMIYPPIEGVLHFCGLKCLAGWVGRINNA